MFEKIFIFLLFFFLIPVLASCRQTEPPVRKDDTLPLIKLNNNQVNIAPDTLQHENPIFISDRLVKKKVTRVTDILNENIFLNSNGKPDSFIISPRRYIPKDHVFYILSAVLLFLGILKVSWPRYFNNLIRVFFNNSLRQGQLTDQLLQAKLPSLFFNLFFVLITGWYFYLLLNHFGMAVYTDWKLLLMCVAAPLLIYLVKFCTLKFTGWLTGYKQEAETYIFIVFLINKMIALCLVPVVIIMPFSNPGLVRSTIIVSYAIIALMFIMRFFRAYGLLQSRLNISGLNFLLYITGAELLPLLLIYRFALIIMSNNL